MSEVSTQPASHKLSPEVPPQQQNGSLRLGIAQGASRCVEHQDITDIPTGAWLQSI